VEIQKDCANEFLMIFDDSYSYKVMCNKNAMKNWVVAKKRTLKLRFVSMSNPKDKKKGFKCLVQCLPAECGGNGTSGENCANCTGYSTTAHIA